MFENLNALSYKKIEVGMKKSFEFSISSEDMKTFAELSGDYSSIHWDTEFANKNGFKGPIVYGALIISKLSYFVGMIIPGSSGLATSWNINFNSPLYVDDLAKITGTVKHKSDATNIIVLKVSVEVGGQLIAAATASSKLLTS